MHPKGVLSANFWKSLIAVVVGNVLYYFIFLPMLPARVQHKPFAMDLGVLVDLWICLVVYGLVELFARWRRRRLGSANVN
jgi:ABC-type uncharacterized transport system permease subunit